MFKALIVQSSSDVEVHYTCAPQARCFSGSEIQEVPVELRKLKGLQFQWLRGLLIHRFTFSVVSGLKKFTVS